MESLMHTCTYICYVNSIIEQDKQDHIPGCLDIEYRKLSKNVPSDSETLFGDDISKREITISN